MKKTYISIIMVILMVLLPSTIIGQDTKDKIKSVIDSYPLKSYQQIVDNVLLGFGGTLFIYSSLPDKQLNKAIINLAEGTITKEDVLLFCYQVMPIVGGGSFIVTEDKLYYFNSINPDPLIKIGDLVFKTNKKGVIDLKSINGFSYNWDSKILIIDGNDEKRIATVYIEFDERDKARTLIDLLNEIVYAADPSKEKIAKQNTEITKKKQSGSNFELSTSQVICGCFKSGEYYYLNENICDSYINSALGFNWKTTNLSQNAAAARKFDQLQSMCR